MKNHKKPSLILFGLFLLVFNYGCNEEELAEIQTDSTLLINPLEIASSTQSALGLTGTLTDKNGEIMRATPMVLSGNEAITDAAVAFATDINNWNMLKNKGFNTVRLCLVDPYYEVQTRWNHWTLQETLPYIDICVANAVQSGMNIIINYHSLNEQGRGKNTDFAKANEYWDAIAPRYKDNDLVYYEITNESSFKEDIYKRTDFVTNYLALYDKVRTLAPERQILIFSWSSLNFDYNSILSFYENNIDWDYTSVAYHTYGTVTNTNQIQSLMQQYRVMCTEWDYPGSSNVPDNVDGYYLISQALENIGNSWSDWRDWGDTTMTEINELLIPDAIEKGYWWGVGGNNRPAVTITSPGDGENFPSASNITITANASDIDGFISKVTFYANGTYLGEDVSAPYSYSWSAIADGAYEIIAIATDDATSTTTSSPINVTVGDASATEILNAGFETGDLTDWTLNGNATVSSDAHTGSYSSAVTSNSSRLSQIINVNPNTTYTLSVWCKKVDSQSGCTIGVENYGGSTVSELSFTTTWQKVSVTFTTGATNTTAEIFMKPQRKNRTHLVDDWELTIGGN